MSRAAGVLAFVMLATLACRGIIIPECRDCHPGKLSQSSVPESDADCDHCEHLHGNPFGCSHRQAADAEARRVAGSVPPVGIAAVVPSVAAVPYPAPDPAPPASVRPGPRAAASPTCGTLRC